MTEQQNATYTISPDGNYIWNGTEWVPTAAHPTAAPAVQKKSRKGLKVTGAVLAAFVVLSIGANALGGSSDDGASDPTAASASQSDTSDDRDAAAEDKAPGIGDSVSDGKFTFTATNVKTGVSQVGDEYLNSEAQGAFTLITLKVKNTGDEPQTFFTDNVKGMDSQGRELASDSEASFYATPDADAWLTEINPGNSATVTVVFDVAKGEKLESIQVHDSLFSNGATIDLR